MRDPNGLTVFLRADEVAKAVYQLTYDFPSEERFHLTSQIRRAATSVPSNLVEGCSRESERDFTRFVEISLGSAMELEYQLGLASHLARKGLLVLSRGHRIDIPSSEAAMAFGREIDLVREQASKVVKGLINFAKTLRSGSGL